ncbi:protein WVD2-like 3 [Phalaenopsis equestris]|uniref:protein WVD2-like 3 n=1 Tax=Phalaenopsis equestris TaxID=78828 RepID=UPI0009E3AF6B|nr:protein WVD2-like 3 [Phalaenopsis equestris]
MPTYEESEDNVICSSLGNLKCTDDQSSLPCETSISHGAMEGSPDRKAYVRITNSEYGEKESSAASPIGVRVSPHEKFLQDNEAANMQNLSIEDGTLKETLDNVTESSEQDTILDSLQFTAKTGNHSVHSNHTVSQPIALATEKRACPSEQKKLSNLNLDELPDNVKKTQVKSYIDSRKPLQPENAKHVDEEDACSIASSTSASLRAFKSRTTVASIPTFRCSERAEKRKEFYSKLEQKHQALEAERNEFEARKKEEQEAALKQLRRNMNFKATPMPNFYHEGPPPKAELKKVPPTRAKSPKLGRRKSCGDSIKPSPADGENKITVRVNRHSLDGSKDGSKSGSFKKRTPRKAEVEKEQAPKVVEESRSHENEGDQETAATTLHS